MSSAVNSTLLTGCSRAVPGKRRDLEFVSPRRDYIEIVQVNCVAGVSDDCAHVAGQEIFAVTHAEHKRASTPRADHEIRDIGMDQSNAIRADHLAKRRANGGKQARFFSGTSTVLAHDSS